jgi:hypothetical protein
MKVKNAERDVVWAKARAGNASDLFSDTSSQSSRSAEYRNKGPS